MLQNIGHLWERTRIIEVGDAVVICVINARIEVARVPRILEMNSKPALFATTLRKLYHLINSSQTGTTHKSNINNHHRAGVVCPMNTLSERKSLLQSVGHTAHTFDNKYPTKSHIASTRREFPTHGSTTQTHIEWSEWYSHTAVRRSRQHCGIVLIACADNTLIIPRGGVTMA